jgi:dethiobiotin synthase
MGRGIFITGTGTDVGKTAITAGLLRGLRAQGLDAVSMKPVQTGAHRDGGVWRSPDLDVHCRAAGLEPDAEEYSRMAPYCYEPACSPHLAARLIGRLPDINHIADCAEQLLARHDALLVEGAGGLMVPLDEKHLLIDLVERLRYPVVVVALAGLGTINHTLLTIEALQRRNLPVLGVVFNEPAPLPRSAIKEDNPKAVARCSGVPVLGSVPHLPRFDHNDPAAWTAFDRAFTGLPTILEHLR